MDNENELDYDIVTLFDENEQAVDYAVIDGIEYNGKMYLALVEADHVNDEECEFLILRSDKDETGDVLVTIEDKDEFDEVLRLFDEKIDDFDLTEDDDDEEEEEEEASDEE